MTDLYQKERFYSKKLRGLDIFGSIKTVHPSEYFFVSDWSVHPQLLKIDVNSEQQRLTARFVDQGDDLKLFVASQAHLFIPDEQKFMFVGGQDPKTELPTKRAFLHSIMNPGDTEMLEDMRLKRQECSLALIETSASQDQKVLVVGGQSNAQTGEYQSACEVFNLQLDIWQINAHLQQSRLSPCLVSLGDGHVLVLGGLY